jgi:metal-responsive CopG/Arc/MetJ family transcriptional regulator
MKRLTVDVPEELMERLDAYCQENFINRTNAVRQWIRTLPLEKPIKKRKTKKESSSQT